MAARRGPAVLRRLAIVLAVLAAFAAPRSLAETGGGEPVCVADAGEALQRAEAFHEIGTKDLMAARGQPWSGISLRDLGPRAARYVKRRAGESLILYAMDAKDLCAFMWFHDGRGGVGWQYARMAGGTAGLASLGEEFRSLIAAGVAASGRGATRQAVDAGDPAEAAPQRPFAEVSRELAALLYPPAFHAALSETSTLSLIPVGAIATVPLAALPAVGDDRPSLERFSINILTLAEDVDTKVYGWVPGFRSPLILGDPAASIAGWSLPPLPGAAREARYVHDLFGGSLRLADAANRRVLAQEAAQSELIVIAAHGVNNPDDPLDGSFLALSDGALTPREIMGLAFPAHPLVVLSACQSGLGRSMDAGVIGLARAFQIAGATNTAMSLWNVDDAATQFQMSRFYDNLRSMTPSAALREAGLAARAKYRDPMKWAAFQMFGVSTVLTAPP
jgi:hypothetical protein